MRQIVDLTQELLDAITASDWPTYERLCDEGMTCFEMETEGRLVHGLSFHKQFFDAGGHMDGAKSEIEGPHVWDLGDVAVIAYVRLVNGQRIPETRVWRKSGSGWKHVHFHRS